MVIENEEIGLKIAEDSQEKMWLEIQEKTATRIKQIEETLIVENAFLEMATEKLKLWKK